MLKKKIKYAINIFIFGLHTCVNICFIAVLLWWEEGSMEAGVAKALKSRSVLPLGKAKER